VEIGKLLSTVCARTREYLGMRRTGCDKAKGCLDKFVRLNFVGC